mgnify:CR=1 FL=1|tara:strand:- start:1441 stop:1602 length:162 start_codon:yes stop_codon:yes gene_type:complete
MAEKKVRSWIVVPKDMDEVYHLITDMRGTQGDLVRVAVMAYQIGLNEGDGDER